MFMLFIPSLSPSNSRGQLRASQFVCSHSPLRISTSCDRSFATITMLSEPDDDSNRKMGWEDVNDMLADVSKKISSLPDEQEEKDTAKEDEEFQLRYAQAQINNGVQPSLRQIKSDNDEKNNDEIALSALISDSFSVADELSDDFPDVLTGEEWKMNSLPHEADSKVSPTNTTLIDSDAADDEERRQQLEQQHQSNPRVSDATKLKQVKELISRRQAKLEHEQHGHQNLDAEVLVEDQVTRTFLPHELSQVHIDSTRNALPFHFNSIDVEGSSQIIECAKHRFYVNLRPPQAIHPFLPLHNAIFNLSHENCPRCAQVIHVQLLKQHVGVCPTCYSKIYLTNPPVKQIVRSEKEFLFPSQDRVVNLEKGPIPLDENEQIEDVKNIIKTVNSTALKQQKEQQESSPTSTGKGSQASVSNNDTKGQTEESNINTAKDSNDEELPPQAVGWKINTSDRAQRTINPIRNLVQNIKVKPNPDKEVIKLSVGDPTVYGNLNVSQSIINTYENVLRNSKLTHGYSHSTGMVHARHAIANRYSEKLAKPLTSDDVILTCGTSGAIELVFGVIANEGDNILLPQPGFPLFRTLANNLGIECQYYRLRPHENWMVELSDFERLINDRTKAIVVNNPSNPCGSVFERSHIEDICDIAEKFRIPIISDEVYADMTFGGIENKFVSFGEASQNVPVLCVGGISKQFVIPGWRLGWILIHDRLNILKKAGIYDGLLQLTTRMLVPNSPAQMVVPALLHSEHRDTFSQVMETLESNATFIYGCLSKIDGLRCIKPQGAMYMMVYVDVVNLGLKDDMHFVEDLYREEAVFVLPGQCFQAPNFFRIVFSAPQHILSDACSRIEAFCKRRVAEHIKSK